MIVTLLGAAQPALAFSDDFDSYDVGSVDGVNGWYGTGTISTDFSASGANSLRLYDASQRWETTPSSGTLSLKVYVTTCNQNADVYGLHRIYGLVGLHIQNCEVNNNTMVGFESVGTITAEAWHTITYDYNTTTGAGTISIDGDPGVSVAVGTGHGAVEYWSFEGHDASPTTYMDDIQTY